MVEAAGQGIDTVLTWVSYELPDNVEALTLARGAGAINGIGNDLANLITGNEGDNLLSGGAGDDTLVGGAGDDTLDGGPGADRLAGGTGNDLYIVNHVGDLVVEAAGQGIDTVLTSVSYELPDNVEALTLARGAGAINGIGNDLANLITGNEGDNLLSGGAGDDTLVGGAGDDTLDGGPGADRLAGGTGNDLYIVNHVGDLVVEAAGQGIDTVLTSVSYELPDNVEALILARGGRHQRDR